MDQSHQHLSNNQQKNENKTVYNRKTSKKNGYSTIPIPSDDDDDSESFESFPRKNNSDYSTREPNEISSRYKSTSVWPLAEGPLDSNNVGAATEQNSRCESRMSTDDDINNEEEEIPFSFKNLTRNQKIILIVTCITNLLSFLSLSILAPFFPLEADSKNVSSAISGWVFGSFALVQFATSPLFGRLVPLVGSRFMFLSGMFISGGCTLAFGFLDYIDVTGGSTTFVVMCFVTRILLALGATAVNNAGFVMLVRAFPDHVGAVFGFGEIFTGVGMVSGPAIGGFLYGAGGFIAPFAVIGGINLLALPIIAKVLPLQEDSFDADEDNGGMSKLVLHPASIINSLAVVVGASVWAILDPTLEPHLRVFGLTPEIVGVLFLIMAAFYSLTSPLWGFLLVRMPDNRLLLIPGFLMCAVGLLLLGPSPVLGFDLSYNNIWVTIAALIILGVSSSMVIIPTYDIYIDVLNAIDYPEDTRTYGMVSGLWVSMYALGDFAGPSLGGYLYEEIGFEWLGTWVAVVCVLTAALVFLSWFIETKCCRKNKMSDIKVISIQPQETTPLLPEMDMGDSHADFLSTFPPPQLLDAAKPLHEQPTSETTFDNDFLPYQQSASSLL